MNKSEWDTMSEPERNELVKDKVFNGSIFVMKHRSVGATGHVEDNIISRFTADRNACALVMDEIDRRGDKVRMKFSDGLKKRMLGHESISWGRTSPEVDILRISPDEICFCAVMAVENE